MNNLGIEDEYYYEIIELIQNIEEGLIDFEKDDTDNSFKELLRYLHSLKGNCGMLELYNLESLYHSLETIILKFQKEVKNNIDPFLDAIDLVKEYIQTPMAAKLNEAKDQILSLTSIYSHQLNKQSIIKDEIKDDVKEVARKPKVIETPLLVYIIDDIPDFLEVFEISIKEKGHRVKSFDKVEDLKDEIDKGEIPDLVISDYNMGAVSGTDVVTGLNVILPLVPKAICSGFLTYELALKLINLGVIGVLEKPFDSVDLDIILKKAIKLRKNNHYIKTMRELFEADPDKFPALKKL